MKEVNKKKIVLVNNLLIFSETKNIPDNGFNPTKNSTQPVVNLDETKPNPKMGILIKSVFKKGKNHIEPKNNTNLFSILNMKGDLEKM